MAFGILEQGFARKTRDDLVESMHSSAKELLGEDIDLSEISEDELRIQLQADELDELWKLAESIYYSNFIHTATGASLDRVCGIGGILREPARRSLVNLKFVGLDTKVIKLGTIAGTSQNIQFITIAEGVISAGECFVQAQSIQTGVSGNVSSDSITEILTPIDGIESVTNPEPATGGRAHETDAELRERYFARGTSGGSSAVAIQSLLNGLPDVNTAIVYENATSFDDPESRPPHSMEAVVEGGDPQNIADLFLKNWPGGIESIGLESASIIDQKNITRTYYFNRPEEVIIKVDIEIEKDIAVWNSSSEENVKTNCIKIIGGIDTIGVTSTAYKGKGIGATLLSWELIAAQLGVESFNTVKVAGIKQMNVLLGKGSDPVTETELNLTGRQKPKLITANIQVGYI